MGNGNGLIDRNFLLVTLRNYDSTIVDKALQELSTNLISAVGELLQEKENEIQALQTRMTEVEQAEKDFEDEIRDLISFRLTDDGDLYYTTNLSGITFELDSDGNLSYLKDGEEE